MLIQVFTESEVRASVVFQLSKLCSLLLKAARLTSGGSGWDALVAGEQTVKHEAGDTELQKSSLLEA